MTAPAFLGGFWLANYLFGPVGIANSLKKTNSKTTFSKGSFQKERFGTSNLSFFNGKLLIFGGWGVKYFDHPGPWLSSSAFFNIEVYLIYWQICWTQQHSSNAMLRRPDEFSRPLKMARKKFQQISRSERQ